MADYAPEPVRGSQLEKTRSKWLVMFNNVRDFFDALNADNGRYADALISYTGGWVLTSESWRKGSDDPSLRKSASV